MHCSGNGLATMHIRFSDEYNNKYINYYTFLDLKGRKRYCEDIFNQNFNKIFEEISEFIEKMQ